MKLGGKKKKKKFEIDTSAQRRQQLGEWAKGQDNECVCVRVFMCVWVDEENVAKFYVYE